MDIADPSQVYLTRWRLLQTPFFGLFLHAIRRPDEDRNLHSHPWNFASLILKGGYIEKRPHKTEVRKAGSIAWRKAEDFHAITKLLRTPTWTLVFIGRNRKNWGYDVDGDFIDHETYHRWLWR
jgi:hypothetical protein